jgi:16S rRNA (cytosine967-C5)-methyltransferase
VERKLLIRATQLVRPGGLLVYCTCSLEPEEGEAQIEALLASNLAFERVPITAAEIGGMPDWITAQGDLRTFPYALPHPDSGPLNGGMDGFYAARLRRRA